MRLDLYLVDSGLFQSRAKAQEALKNKAITVDGVVRKASFQVEGTEEILIVKDVNPYVSRGGLKLQHALNSLDIHFKDKIVLDVGASTGGFTEVSLEYGAKHVYSVDVGTLQLDERLKQDERVTSYENLNILDLKEEHFVHGSPDWIVMDVSFVSIKKIIPFIKKFTSQMIILIKPQFESEGKFLHKGVIKNKNDREFVLKQVINFIENEELKVQKVLTSPIKGKEGNVEYIAFIE